MKKFLQTFGILFTVAIYGQSISDYKYIIVPQEFADAKANRYNLKQLLSTKLQSKKYIIVNESSAPNNPCDALKTEVLNTSNMFTNKVKVEFKNCHNAVVASFDGKSVIKDFEPGMREALENAVKGIASSNPVEKKFEESTKTSENVVVKEIPKQVEVVEKVVVAENSTPKTSVKTATSQNKSEVYSNGTFTLNKINISANQFILANPNTSVPYAIFNASSKKDVYRVQLENGIQTLGYIESGNIVVEIATSDGSFGKEIFVKK